MFFNCCSVAFNVSFSVLIVASCSAFTFSKPATLSCNPLTCPSSSAMQAVNLSIVRFLLAMSCCNFLICSVNAATSPFNFSISWSFCWLEAFRSLFAFSRSATALFSSLIVPFLLTTLAVSSLLHD